MPHIPTPPIPGIPKAYAVYTFQAIRDLFEEVADDVGVFLGKPLDAPWISTRTVEGAIVYWGVVLGVVEGGGNDPGLRFLQIGGRKWLFSGASWRIFGIKVAVLCAARHGATWVVDFLFPGPAEQREGERVPSWSEVFQSFNSDYPQDYRTRLIGQLTQVILFPTVYAILRQKILHAIHLLENNDLFVSWILQGRNWLHRNAIRPLLLRILTIDRSANATWRRTAASIARGFANQEARRIFLYRYTHGLPIENWPGTFFPVAQRVSEVPVALRIFPVARQVFPVAQQVFPVAQQVFPVAQFAPPEAVRIPLNVLRNLSPAEQQLNRLLRLAAGNADFAARNAQEIARLQGVVAAEDAAAVRAWQAEQVSRARFRAIQSAVVAQSDATSVAASAATRTSRLASLRRLPFAALRRGLRALPIVNDAVFVAELSASAPPVSIAPGSPAFIRAPVGDRLLGMTAGEASQAIEGVLNGIFQELTGNYLLNEPGSESALLFAPFRAYSTRPQVGYGAADIRAINDEILLSSTLQLPAVQQLGQLWQASPAIAQGLTSWAAGQLARFSSSPTAQANRVGALQGDIVWSIGDQYDFNMQLQDLRDNAANEGQNLEDILPPYVSGAIWAASHDMNLRLTMQRRNPQGRFTRESPPIIPDIPNFETRWNRALDYVMAVLQERLMSQQQQPASGGGSGPAAKFVEYVAPGPGRNFWLYRGRDRNLILQTLRDMKAIVERDTFAASGKKTTTLRNREPIFPADVPGLSGAILSVISALSYDASLVRNRGGLGGYHSLNEAG